VVLAQFPIRLAMFPRASSVLCALLLIGSVSCARPKKPTKRQDNAPNVNVSTLLAAVGTPYCMKPCIGGLALEMKKILSLTDTTVHLDDLCREYALAEQCLDKRMWCRMRNIFDVGTSGIEHACVTKKSDYAKQKPCLKKHLDGILQSCDATCHVRQELATLSSASTIQTASRAGGNLFMVAKQLAPFCTAVRCGLTCVVKAANAACPKSGSLMLDSFLQPFDKAAALYDKAPQMTRKLVRGHLKEDCLSLIDTKKLAEMRKGKF
ncbi:hypothetical protein PENTCL1PPCAC_15581, partial [Pristionchus entomophagus]